MGPRSDQLTFAARTWHRSLQEYERQAAVASEDCLGPERDVFLRALAGIKFILEKATPPGEVTEDTVRAKLACANRGFVLLWASWADVLTARYAAAAEHWRSLFETPHFILAFSYDRTLVDNWLNGNADFETARKAIRKFLGDQGMYAEAKEWERRRKSFDSAVQKFSHVTVESAIATLPAALGDQGQAVATILTTQVTPRKTREYALFLARDAMELMRACGYAFNDIQEVRTFWEEYERHICEADAAALREVYSYLGLDDGKGTESGGE